MSRGGSDNPHPPPTDRAGFPPPGGLTIEAAAPPPSQSKPRFLNILSYLHGLVTLLCAAIVLWRTVYGKSTPENWPWILGFSIMLFGFYLSRKAQIELNTNINIEYRSYIDDSSNFNGLRSLSAPVIANLYLILISDYGTIILMTLAVIATLFAPIAVSGIYFPLNTCPSSTSGACPAIVIWQIPAVIAIIETIYLTLLFEGAAMAAELAAITTAAKQHTPAAEPAATPDPALAMRVHDLAARLRPYGVHITRNPAGPKQETPGTASNPGPDAGQKIILERIPEGFYVRPDQRRDSPPRSD